MGRKEKPSEDRIGSLERAVSKLKLEKEVLTAIAETTSALVFVLNTDFRIVFFNNTCESVTGYLAQEVKGKLLWEQLVDPSLERELKRILGQIQPDSKPVAHEHAWQTHRGEKRLISWRIAAIAHGHQGVDYYIGTGMDITEQSENHQMLQHRSHELGDRIKELRCLYGISRLRERKDLTLDEIVQGIVDLIPPAWQYPEITCSRIILGGQRFASTSFKETKWKLSAPIVALDVEAGVLEVYYSEHRPQLHEGPFHRYERNLVDIIAERLGRVIEHHNQERRVREYQQQLRQLASQQTLAEERERRRFAVELHDRIGQNLAIAKIKLAGKIQEDADASLAEVMALIERTIQETRTLTYELSPPILHELGFEAALEWLAVKFQKDYGVTLEFRDDQASKPLTDDQRVVLFQAARELLNNIAKHAKAKQASLHVKRSGGNVLVSVVDDGVGMDVEQVREKWTADGAFGLFSIQERLDHLGGNAEIVSEPGHGTKVILTVPITSADDKRVAPPAILRDSSEARIRILLVEDQQITREGLRALVEKYDDIFVEAEASDGEEAVRLSKEIKPDVVVMDVALPGMSGITATRNIVQALPQVKVVALSMHAESHYILEMLRAGASGYLLKDCAQDDLAQAIRAVNGNLTFFSAGIANNVIKQYLQHPPQWEKREPDVLSPRETEVLKLLADGESAKEIAKSLDLSIKTVESHRQHIMQKLDIQSIAQLTKYAIQIGLTKLEIKAD